MYKALQNAICTYSPEVEVDVVTPAMVRYQKFSSDEGVLLCPLTIDLPEQIPFQQRELFEACRQVDARRQWVLDHTEYQVCQNGAMGDHWLPVIVSGAGYQFGSVIGEGIMPNSYHQSTDVTGLQCEALRVLGHRLLDAIAAPPSVYLVQFTFSQNREVVFDRLWPFPAAPAIATLTDQAPSLFDYHWCCLMNQNLDKLAITPQLAI